MSSSIDEIRYRVAGPTIRRFHASNRLVRIIRGPIGSGKSTASCMEIMLRALAQPPGKDGVARSRWAIVRSTYPELKTTTIKTWQQWIPEHVFGPIRWTVPIYHKVMLKPKCELEVYFLSADRESDVKKFQSLELTGVWINELGAGVPKPIFEVAIDRVGRYPSTAHTREYWSGVICDTNSPSKDHWLYQLESNPPPGIEFFIQPPAVIKKNGKWAINPDAENLANLKEDYYPSKLTVGKSDAWIRRFLANEYVSLTSDQAVFKDSFNQQIHVVDALSPLRDRGLVIGMDFGLTPAAVITQMDDYGRLRVYDEVVGENIGVESFINDLLTPFLSTHYPTFPVLIIGDPAGRRRSETDEKTVFDVLRSLKYKAYPAPSNSILERIEAVRYFMTRISRGEPAFRVASRCVKLIEALAAGYRYKRINVASSDGEVRYKNMPEKDKHSHISDALQYAALYFVKRIKQSSETLPKVDTAPVDRIIGI